MRRKLNEGEEFNEELLDGVKICVSDIRNDDSEMDCNELRDIFVEAGAEVFGSHGLKNGKPVTIMTVKGLPEEEVLEILQEFLDDSDTCDDAEAYEVNDDLNNTLHDPDNDDYEFPDYEDADALHDPDNNDYEFPSYEDVETDDLDPEEDALNDDFLNEGEDILEDAQEELRSLLSNLGENDNITFEPKLGLDEANIISIDSNGDMETEDGDIINAFDLADADDIFTLCDEVKMELDNEAAYPDYDDIDDEEDEELPRFEKIHKGRHLDEKKKNNCCPGTKNINESVIDSVLADLDEKALNESKNVELKNQKELEKKTLKALTENKHSLHTNVRYNGKSFAKMTLKELKSIYETVKASVDALSERLLNESVVDNKTTETIDRKKQLLEFLDEEITYRTTRMECLRKLNEDSAEISDEELANLFGPAQGEDEASTDNGDDNTEGDDSNEDDEENKEDNKDENNEENEEVELSRIEITLKDAEAANDLKQACLDADIPEDAFELENVEDDTFEEDGEESEDNSEEASEDSSEENSEEENSEEGANESYEFAKYVKMLGEGEVADEQPGDDAAGEESSEEENGAENADGEGDEENSEEDKQPKFILTNTDYASKLAKVLEDVYGISKEEFEDMIGGEIVEEEPKEDEENSDEEGSENSEESKDEESKDSSEEKKDDEEELDPSDLFKNL